MGWRSRLGLLCFNDSVSSEPGGQWLQVPHLGQIPSGFLINFTYWVSIKVLFFLQIMVTDI